MWKDVVSGDTIEVPAGAEKVLFVRFDGKSTVNEWNDDTVWNQTEDLILGSGTTYTITSYGSYWGAKLIGSWS